MVWATLFSMVLIVGAVMYFALLVVLLNLKLLPSPPAGHWASKLILRQFHRQEAEPVVAIGAAEVIPFPLRGIVSSAMAGEELSWLKSGTGYGLAAGLKTVATGGTLDFRKGKQVGESSGLERHLIGLPATRIMGSAA